MSRGYSALLSHGDESVRMFAPQFVPERASMPFSARAVRYQRYHAKRRKDKSLFTDFGLVTAREVMDFKGKYICLCIYMQ